MMEEYKREDCGTTEDVEKTTCPYIEDIYGEVVEVFLCQKCYNERCMDI